MKKLNLEKWTVPDQTEGMLFFAQCFCEMLEDDTLDSYKAPALNLHLSFIELSILIGLFDDNRIRKGSLKFSLNECIYKTNNDIILCESKRRLLKKYLKQISTLIDSTENAVNTEKLLRIIESARAQVNFLYWPSLKEKIIETCKLQDEKKQLRQLSAELAAELELIGFSKQYVLAKTKKFFFSAKIKPYKITSSHQIEDFLSIFDVKDSEWDVYFIANNTTNKLTKYMADFGIKQIRRTPKTLTSNIKYQLFEKKQVTVKRNFEN